MKKSQTVIRSAVRKNKIVSLGAPASALRSLPKARPRFAVQHRLQQGYVKALQKPFLPPHKVRNTASIASRHGFFCKKTLPTSSK